MKARLDLCHCSRPLAAFSLQEEHILSDEPSIVLYALYVANDRILYALWATKALYANKDRTKNFIKFQMLRFSV